MVEEPTRKTNSTYLADFIELIANPLRTDSDKLKEFYLEKGLSASELGSELGISKTAVLEQLHDLGIRKTRIGRDPDNYKFPQNPPYGYDVRGGRLVPNRIEMKVANRFWHGLLGDLAVVAGSPRFLERSPPTTAVGCFTINHCRPARWPRNDVHR